MFTTLTHITTNDMHATNFFVCHVQCTRVLCAAWRDYATMGLGSALFIIYYLFVIIYVHIVLNFSHKLVLKKLLRVL